ncbi:MAG: TIGR03016 family PEP-CTERM system-associated outer membrane protein [Burkholderiales bacterium]|nr:TIGR03016 family PEP-CTERM system-associated outer membrane protein [Burkholderiales bacterium]
MRPIVRCGIGMSAGALALAATGLRAQTAEPPDGTSGRAFAVVPSLSITETLTDNARLVGVGRQSDLITQVTPSIRISSTGGRVKGFLNYALNGLAYARHSQASNFQNSLNALANVEAIENWAFLDASANISQQSISAFGTQSTDSSVGNANRTEVRTYNISPYVRGRLAGLASYEARLTHTGTSNSTTAASNSSSDEAKLRLAGDSPLRVLSWSADATRQVIDYTIGRRTEDDSVRGELHFAVDPQLQLTLIDGRESNDYVSLDKQSHNTPGWALDWKPTERTRISAQREQRFFGNSHSYLFEHRTPRTVWRYSNTRDIATGFGQPTAGSLGTAYDLFFAQFASQQPDPALRATLVNNFLLANGIAPTAQLFGGSLTSAVMLQRRQDLSFAMLGVRDTVTFTASQSDARRLDSVVSVTDDFSNGNNVRQRGYGVNLAHRLTPMSALNLIASMDRTSGSTAAQTTTLRSISLAWSGRLGPRSSGSVSARHSVFDSATTPYKETAVTAALSLQF